MAGTQIAWRNVKPENVSQVARHLSGENLEGGDCDLVLYSALDRQPV